MPWAGEPTAERLCPWCGAAEPILSGEGIWPAGWRCRSCARDVPVQDGVPLYAPALADTVTGMDPAGFAYLAEVEAGHFWFEPRNRLLVGLAGKYLPAARTLLEIGCGTGFVLAAFAASGQFTRLVGAELHPAGLSYARRRLGPRAEFVQMDARAIPACRAFDLIGAFDVLEHIEEDLPVLRAVHGALADGGGFIAAVPQHPILWSAADEYAHHIRRYRRGELERKLTDSGFRILFATSYASLVLPLMLASRLVPRRNKGGAEPPNRAEFELPAALNTAFRRVLEGEVWAILSGWRWPAGGSRVVVAQKVG